MFQEGDVKCPCLLCHVARLKIRNCKILISLMKRDALRRTYKEPEENCPFHKTWTYIKGHADICCCLKHVCNQDKLCSCLKCNILTRVRLICHPDHFEQEPPCTGPLCTKLLPVSTPCVHVSCMTSVEASAQILNTDADL